MSVEDEKTKVRYTDMTDEQKREYHRAAYSKWYNTHRAKKTPEQRAKTPEQKQDELRKYKTEKARQYRARDKLAFLEKEISAAQSASSQNSVI